MKAQIITDRQQWNDFVAASELCNLTQTYEWGELMSNRRADSLHVGVVKDDGSLCAVMLVLVATVPVLRVPYFYAPRGPIVEDPASPAMTLLLNFVKAEAHKRGACMLKVEPGVPDGDRTWLNALRHYGFCSIPYAHHLRHEWVTDIRGEEQELMSKMHKKTRQYIRTSARTGVVIRESHEQSGIDAFYRIYCETGERSEFMILSKEYYENFLRLYKDNAALLVAEYDNRIIAAAIVVRLGRWSWNMYEAASNESREMRINYLLQWQRILWAKSHGCWYFNSRGIPDVLEEGNELYGVYNFKRGFGGYAMRSLETQDLVYRPLVYQAYRLLLDGKHWYESKQAAKRKAEELKQAEQKKAAREAAQQANPAAGSVQEQAPAQKTPAATRQQIPETPRPEAVPNATPLPSIPETPRPASKTPKKQKKAFQTQEK
ncbi:peptidoglycan bridge formation glycyltransferase FemA/FemB family protein [Dictyobacter formicarum]|uniref:N-acetyltransferase domain-containing protein n=1 Tax=Dictyobacter formicarum TaxID=2778368 RepID=A0ABQ3VCV8_9CHLR|nr:peptidoglycan bridge formation glycyltransferase FemA/FemB family protein [Dictyobacter formicarum]GHO83638.1 hypothetical protein KSZ_16440 [Dictyobacter formicarum]